MVQCRAWMCILKTSTMMSMKINWKNTLVSVAQLVLLWLWEMIEGLIGVLGLYVSPLARKPTEPFKLLMVCYNLSFLCITDKLSCLITQLKIVIYAYYFMFPGVFFHQKPLYVAIAQTKEERRVFLQMLHTKDRGRITKAFWFNYWSKTSN